MKEKILNNKKNGMLVLVLIIALYLACVPLVILSLNRGLWLLTLLCFAWFGLGWIPALGLKVLIDFHYSDFWADPGKQWAPKAWEKDDAKKVQWDVYDYTRQVLADFKAAGALPEMVQVGNEITNGMIWPLGKLPSADNGKTLASFVASGLKAVHDTDAGIKTMIHIAIQDQPAVHGAQGRQVYARRLDAGRRPVEVQALCGDRRRGADGRYPGYEVE